MKALLRLSLITLLLLGAYAGAASRASSTHVPTLPTPVPQITH
jgi:hypothetical protein